MGNNEEIYYKKFKQFIYNNYGIYFSETKKGLLMSKLRKLMNRNNIGNYEDYFKIINDAENKSLITEFINEITVHKTDFFREISHFNFLLNNINLILKKNPRILQKGEIRIWCSACSTGQEAYTLAIVFNEILKKTSLSIELKILATDIATNVLGIAQRGTYALSIESEIESNYLKEYFEIQNGKYVIKDKIKENIFFRKFNVIEEFPFINKFDIVFCRNMMIYFDIPTQETLLGKIYNHMTEGGLLFIGQSESLINKKNEFSYLQPSIYIK